MAGKRQNPGPQGCNAVVNPLGKIQNVFGPSDERGKNARKDKDGCPQKKDKRTDSV